MRRISIIVPVYSVERYLPRCAASILAQSVTDFELILIDDGSPDRSSELCDEYALRDERLLTVHKSSGGVSAARNTGLDAATGKYIAFADSDDWVAEHWLRETGEAIERYDADIVSYRYRKVSVPGCYGGSPAGHLTGPASGHETIGREGANHEGANHEGTEHEATGHEMICCEVTGHGGISHEAIGNDEERFQMLLGRLRHKSGEWAVWSALFRRDLIEKKKLRFCLNCRDFAEDMVFHLSYLMHAEKSVALPDALYCYNDTRPDSITQKSRHVCRIDELNEASKALEAQYRLVFRGTEYRSKYGLLHHYIILNQLKGFYDLYGFRYLKEMKTWKQRFNRIGDPAFFRKFNKEYYALAYSGPCSYIPHNSDPPGQIFDRFLCSMNTAQFIWAYLLWNTLELPHRILRKVNKIKVNKIKGQTEL